MVDHTRMDLDPALKHENPLAESSLGLLGGEIVGCLCFVFISEITLFKMDEVL